MEGIVAVICNFAGTAHPVVFLVGLVEPVELHGIPCGHVGPTRGTGGTGVVRHDANPTAWFHQ